MALGSLPVAHLPAKHQADDAADCPFKKIKLDFPMAACEKGPSTTVPCHPLGIRPAGNSFTASVDSRVGMGSFSRLPEDLLLSFLEILGALDLLRLGQTCKALFAFTRAEELWKTLYVRSCRSLTKSLRWRGSWRSTYLSLPASYEATVACQDLFSDALYRPFFCANVPLEHYASNIPPRNQIRRLPDLSQEEYSAHWTNKPFILTEPVKQWPAYKQWTVDTLLAEYGNVSFRAEAIDWPLRTYVDYMINNTDESPLYLFDCRFAKKMAVTVGKDVPDAIYWPPHCIGEDLFALLGSHRPDSRWLIMGPARSGSTMHKDPNATSAWNAVLTGRKYWLLFPPRPNNVAPPGVFLSPDGAEITSPLSIAEYLLSFHAEARRTPGCVEAVCLPGELVHVPSGWFHLVLNLEPGIALTQNFVPRARLPDVLAFLRDHPEQVSGFADDLDDPFGMFVDCLQEQRPSLLEDSLKAMDSKGRKEGKWQEIIGGQGVEKNLEDKSFSFGFTMEDE